MMPVTLSARLWSKTILGQFPCALYRHSPASSVQCLRNFHSSSTNRLAPQESIRDSQSHPASSVDPSEVHHFNALASTWWDPYGPSRLLHLMNPLRHDFIAYCRSTDVGTSTEDQKLRYLDVGCGGGIFAESAARLPLTASVTAIDPSSEVLAVAKTHARGDPLLQEQRHSQTRLNDDKMTGLFRRLTYLHTTVEDLPLPAHDKDRADIVTAFEVIEHVPRPSSFLEAVTAHVRPGGWLILSTIARTWASWLTTKVVAENLLRVVPSGTHDWNKYINKNELADWFLQREGWITPQALGVIYVPGYGWKVVPGTEKLGNYFFGIRKDPYNKGH